MKGQEHHVVADFVNYLNTTGCIGVVGLEGLCHGQVILHLVKTCIYVTDHLLHLRTCGMKVGRQGGRDYRGNYVRRATNMWLKI